MGRYKKRMKFKGCVEDCFKCPYPDCLKSGKIMKSDKNLNEALRVGNLKSSPKMYTLELGRNRRKSQVYKGCFSDDYFINFDFINDVDVRTFERKWKG